MDKNQSRKAVTAAVIGNILEWYDFAVYGFMAGIIARQFFPADNEVTSLLAAFAAFGVGFVLRPLGGIIIGRIGDTRGRKTALLITIFLMAFGTIMMGLIPGYAAIGIAAPILLVTARMIQGFSAGGEWGGATAFMVEWAPENRRGFYGSFQQMSTVSGLLLGSGTAALVSTLLPAEAMDGWGWRVPFLLGGLLGPVGLYMRRNIDETPAFQAVRASAKKPPMTENAWRLSLRAFGFTILWTVSYYIMLTYMPTFAQKYLGFSRSAALWSNTIGLVALVVFIPLMGRLSDRLGRKPLLLTCCVGFILLPYPLFAFMLSGIGFATMALIQLGFAVLISCFSGPGPTAISEIFPTHSRSTLMSTSYSLATAIFGGFAPFIATWLIDITQSPISPTYYLIAAAVVSTIVIAGLRETAHDKLA